MKKQILLLFLSVCLFTGLNAQQYGISAGINSNRWNGDVDKFARDLAAGINAQAGFSGFNFKPESRTGFTCSFYMDFPLNTYISVPIELGYIQKGTKFAGRGSYSGYQIEENMIMQTDYLLASAMVKANLAKEGVRPFVLAGLSTDLIVRSNMYVEATLMGETNSQSQKYEGFSNADIQLLAGAGIMFSEKIGIDFKYRLGLNNVLEKDASDGYIMKNAGLEIRGIVFF